MTATAPKTLASESPLIETIRSDDDAIRHRSLDTLVDECSLAELLDHASALDAYRREEPNLYRRVRALFFLAAIHRYHLPPRINAASLPDGTIPVVGHDHYLARRFPEAIDAYLAHAREHGFSDAIASALSAAYHSLGLQTLADQVRRSVRTVSGNRWMFRIGHPLDHPLRIRRELRPPSGSAAMGSAAAVILRETTAVRMDVSHSGWSDIFFLGMDYPEAARVLNISVDLGVWRRDDAPKPPIETSFRVIDQPVIRLVSVDLNASVEVTSIAEMFDFARDHLGLLKAAVIAAGLVPPGLEGARASLRDLLTKLIGPGKGFELVSQINDIPKGSRLAVSTNLLGSLISVLMRATSQIDSIEGMLQPKDRRLVAARAILGEWIGGSGGGWQDSGGVWPGIKLIEGAVAGPDDPEFGISRGRLMPQHTILGSDRVSASDRDALRRSLVLVHGGMAQNVGPILEMVTDHYLLRGQTQWEARQRAMKILDEVTEAISNGDVQRLGELTTENFEGPLQKIIPWATNQFTDRLIAECRQRWGDRFWGFWMLGGMSGGGMGFLFEPNVHAEARQWLAETMLAHKREMQDALPFAMDPVVYDFDINDRGSCAELLTGDDAIMSPRYYSLMLPTWLRTPPGEMSRRRRGELSLLSRRLDDARLGKDDAFSPTLAASLIQGMLPSEADGRDDEVSLDAMLSEIGFDRTAHEEVVEDLRSGRIGLMQNRLPVSVTITDVHDDDVEDTRGTEDPEAKRLGQSLIDEGRVGVVTLAAGVGSRWTDGAGVTKAVAPVAKLAGRHRSFLDIHMAKNRRFEKLHGVPLPQAITTSHLTDAAIRRRVESGSHDDLRNHLYVSTGRHIGLRLVPTAADLRFAWEETSQQVLDAQQQKMRQSVRAAQLAWVRSVGEATDYTDNVPRQCIHPVGHWYEMPGLIRSGTLSQMLADQPRMRYLMLHNIDTLGAWVDPSLLGRFARSGNTLNYEVMPRRLDDRGGGLARVDGRVRLVEGLAMPDERIEFDLRYYNSMTTWIEIDGLLGFFDLTRDDLNDPKKFDPALRRAASRLPTYVTIKDVKKRWGHGQEDVFPVAQFEKLWGDMSAMADVSTGYFVVEQSRGGQLKHPSQLDPWWRDGTAEFVRGLCEFR